MQIFAFDGNRRLVSADRALRKADYYCLECGGIVRLRGGIHRKAHFFHLGRNELCRQSKKSLVHLQVQDYLLNLLPLGECFLERQFPEIDRIADVVWEPRKLVFEVQCSPISRDEVKKRNSDYKRLGYNVIWVLHENRFNRWKVTAAELFLRYSPYYFTDIDSLGRGGIYDQVDVFHGGLRKTFLKISGVRLDRQLRPASQSKVDKLQIPSILSLRLADWPLHFEGDLIDCWIRSEPEALAAVARAHQFEKSFYKKAASPFAVLMKKIIHAAIVRPYAIFLQYMLEKACK